MHITTYIFMICSDMHGYIHNHEHALTHTHKTSETQKSYVTLNMHFHTKKSKNREKVWQENTNNKDKTPPLAADTHTDTGTQLMQNKIVQDRSAASQRTCFGNCIHLYTWTNLMNSTDKIVL